jgi:hypothetical protein
MPRRSRPDRLGTYSETDAKAWSYELSVARDDRDEQIARVNSLLRQIAWVAGQMDDEHVVFPPVSERERDKLRRSLESFASERPSSASAFSRHHALWTRAIASGPYKVEFGYLDIAACMVALFELHRGIRVAFESSRSGEPSPGLASLGHWRRAMFQLYPSRVGLWAFLQRHDLVLKLRPLSSLVIYFAANGRHFRPEEHPGPPIETPKSLDREPAPRLVVSLRHSEDVNVDAVVDGIVELVAALDAYYRATGGSGLVLDGWETYSGARTVAGVP